MSSLSKGFNSDSAQARLLGIVNAIKSMFQLRKYAEVGMMLGDPGIVVAVTAAFTRISAVLITDQNRLPREVGLSRDVVWIFRLRACARATVANTIVNEEYALPNQVLDGQECTWESTTFLPLYISLTLDLPLIGASTTSVCVVVLWVSLIYFSFLFCYFISTKQVPNLFKHRNATLSIH